MVVLLLLRLLSAAPASAETPVGVALSAPLAWVRWSDNLFQEATLDRAEVSSSFVTGALASVERGVVALRLGAVWSAGQTRFAPYMSISDLKPYRTPRSLGYLVAGMVLRRPSVVLDSGGPGLHWLPRAGLSYWANLAYEDEFHDKSRATLSRAEQIELDELFFEVGADAEFRVAKGWAGRVSILVGYNLLGEDIAWIEGLEVMQTTRYLPIDFALGGEVTLVRRAW
jgi:hypothetical protein